MIDWGGGGSRSNTTKWLDRFNLNNMWRARTSGYCSLDAPVAADMRGEKDRVRLDGTSSTEG